MKETINIKELPCYPEIELDELPLSNDCDGCEFKVEIGEAREGPNRIGYLYGCEHGYWKDEY